jgi:hypothetical protein
VLFDVVPFTSNILKMNFLCALSISAFTCDSKLESFKEKYKEMNIEGYWTTFKSHLFNAMDQYIPSKTLTSRWNIPWINQNIKKMIRKKVSRSSFVNTDLNCSFNASAFPLLFSIVSPLTFSVGTPTVSLFLDFTYFQYAMLRVVFGN